MEINRENMQILKNHEQNPYENEVWNSQNPIYNLFLALKEEI